MYCITDRCNFYDSLTFAVFDIILGKQCLFHYRNQLVYVINSVILTLHNRTNLFMEGVFGAFAINIVRQCFIEILAAAATRRDCNDLFVFHQIPLSDIYLAQPRAVFVDQRPDVKTKLPFLKAVEGAGTHSCTISNW